MKKLFILIFLFASCSATSVQEDTKSFVIQRKDEFRVITPEAKWGSIYFNAINKQAAKFELTDLRSKPLPEGDLEVRLWLGWGLVYLQGFTLNRVAGEWSATFLNEYKQTLKKLPSPKSGWETAWQKLEKAGLLTLPDQEELNCDMPALDGQYYVIEYSLGNTYRTYKYSETDYPMCDEAKQIMEIRNIIAEEFGILGKIKIMEPPKEVNLWWEKYKEQQKSEIK